MKRVGILATVLLAGLAVVARAQQGESPAELYHGLAEEKALPGVPVGAGISAGILVEVEASHAEQDGEAESDLTLATVEVGLDAEPLDGVFGHVLFLYEEDGRGSPELDEAYIRLDRKDTIRTFLQAGRQYLPFGAFNSHFVSDPATVDLGETRETALLAGCEMSLFSIKAGVFSGDVDDEEDEQFNDLFAALTVTPMDGVEAGVYWISDLGESDGLQDAWNAAMEPGPEGEDAEPVSYDRVQGAGAHVSITVGRVRFDGEYVAALDEFPPGFLGDEAFQPSAWDAEVAIVPAERWEVAARIEGTERFPGFPRTQYGAACAYRLNEHVSLKAEYLRGEFDDAGDRDLVSGQIAAEF